MIHIDYISKLHGHWQCICNKAELETTVLGIEHNTMQGRGRYIGREEREGKEYGGAKSKIKK